jgi:replicative DNA helicase
LNNQTKDSKILDQNLRVDACPIQSIEYYERYCEDDKVISSFELQAKLLKEKKTPHINIKSLIPGIDYACEGFQDGELIVISGPTKNGKTLLAQTLTVNFTKQKEFSGWFTYEVPPRQFLGQFQELPLFYLPQKNKAQDFNWFMERCLESHFKYHTRVFFIDHLHYLIDMARIKNTSLDIGTIVRRIKRFAVDNDFVIFLLAHIGKNETEELSYRDLRDSSFIAQESDTVIMIKRTPKESQTSARARVEFHRRTGKIEWIVYLDKQNGVLKEVIKDGENSY